MPIKYLDMFAGIGGFRSGLDLLGGFECIGSCEIDIYAKQAYDAIYTQRRYRRRGHIDGGCKSDF